MQEHPSPPTYIFRLTRAPVAPLTLQCSKAIVDVGSLISAQEKLGTMHYGEEKSKLLIKDLSEQWEIGARRTTKRFFRNFDGGNQAPPSPWMQANNGPHIVVCCPCGCQIRVKELLLQSVKQTFVVKREFLLFKTEPPTQAVHRCSCEQCPRRLLKSGGSGGVVPHLPTTKEEEAPCQKAHPPAKKRRKLATVAV